MALRHHSKRIAYILIMVLLFSCFAIPIQTQAGTKKYDKIHIAENKLWYFDYMDVPEAWNYIDAYKKAHPEKKFNKVKVAILDTGVQLSHDDLQANLDKTYCVDVTKSGNPKYKKPAGSHGTATAGIIGATSKNKLGGAGVAAGNHNNLIQLMPIKIFRDDASTVAQGKASTDDIIKGLDYAYKNGARVVSMCCGHYPYSEDAFGEMQDDAALERKIDELVNNGVVVVCSAGNKESFATWYPSDFSSCISVIASKRYTDIDGICKRTDSSYGMKKDISAPGEDILTTSSGNRYSKFHKTSAAVSLLSGVVALMLYVNPDLTVDEVKDILYRTATDTFTRGFDIYSGYGNVNAYGAVTAAVGDEKYISPKMAKAPHVTAKSDSSSSIKLTWNKVSGATKYELYQFVPRAGHYELILSTTDTSYVLGGLKFNTDYSFAAVTKATSADGKRADSDLGNVTVARPTTGYTTIKAKKVKKDNTKVKISWSAATSADGYIISAAKKSKGSYKKKKTIKSGDAGSVAIKAPNGKKKSYYMVIPYKVNENGRKVFGPATKISR